MLNKKAIQHYLIDHDLTQGDFAKTLGISTSYFSKLLNGRKGIPLNILFYPFIPGKRMVDGYFYCSDCGWDGQIWEHIGFGDMLAYEAVHCPKCGAIIERRA